MAKKVTKKKKVTKASPKNARSKASVKKAAAPKRSSVVPARKKAAPKKVSKSKGHGIKKAPAKPKRKAVKKQQIKHKQTKKTTKKVASNKKIRRTSIKTTPKKPARRKPRTPRATVSSRSKSRKTRPFIKIKVVGVGGGGGNAITRMRRNFSVRGVEFVAINTDVQDLESCDAHKKLHIGRVLTKGMGAGMNPDLGQQAAEESSEEIAEVLKGADMVFITSGFGGGTGTGAAPVVAGIARDLDILTVAVITKPFSFEGTTRAKIAEDGMARIKDKVDTLLIIPNDRIFGIIDKNTSVLKAFEKIDGILKSAVQGVAEIISASGLVNVDFADVRAVAAGAGMAVIGVGIGTGADRAVKAVNQAVHSPLLDISIDGARSILFGVAGGRDLRMSEINEAAKIITESVDPGAKIIFGAYHDRKLRSGALKITLIATGFNGMLFKRESDSLTLFSDDADLLGGTMEVPGEMSEAEVTKGTAQRSEEEEEENQEEILDTPTFLRKRRRRR